MKMSSFTTVSVLALTGLFLTLSSTNTEAKDHSSRAARQVEKLPADARPVRFNGERCWYSNGEYFRNISVGLYVTIAKPMFDESGEEEDDLIVKFLPEDSATVYVDGERCWVHDGCYYRQVGRAYQKFNASKHSIISRKAPR